MRKLILFLLLSVPAWATFAATPAHSTLGANCSTSVSTCVTTLSATATAGRLLIQWIRVTGTHAITTCTDSVGSSTWVHCPNCNGGTAAAVDMCYTLVTVGTPTTVTANINTAGASWAVEVDEWAYTGFAAFDTSNKDTQGVATTHQEPALTLTGTNELITNALGNAASVTSIDSSYTVTNKGVGYGFAYLVNTTSTTQPTWTTASAAAALGAAAFNSPSRRRARVMQQ